MKKLLIIILTLIMLFVFFACDINQTADLSSDSTDEENSNLKLNSNFEELKSRFENLLNSEIDINILRDGFLSSFTPYDIIYCYTEQYSHKNKDSLLKVSDINESNALAYIISHYNNDGGLSGELEQSRAYYNYISLEIGENLSQDKLNYLTNEYKKLGLNYNIIEAKNCYLKSDKGEVLLELYVINYDGRWYLEGILCEYINSGFAEFIGNPVNSEYYIVYNLSNIMEPAVEEYSFMLVDNSIDKYFIGDPIVFIHDDIQYFSRIVSINEDGSFRVKGDNNLREYDFFITTDDILGKSVIRDSDIVATKAYDGNNSPFIFTSILGIGI